MAKANHKTPSAIELLKHDHERLKQARRRFEKMDRRDRPAVQALVKDACRILETHVRLEDELFYPAVRKVLRDEDLMHEADIAHDFARLLMGRLKRMKATDSAYVATFTVLCDYVVQHIEDEESEIFTRVRRGKLDLQALGRKLIARRNRLEEAK
jgi:hemerythrin-like domain-containing protein